MKKKQENSKKPLFQRFIKKIYKYRWWWVDIPIGVLFYIFHQHFYSHGVHPVPSAMPDTCMTILGMYLFVKEGIIRRKKEIQPRPGRLLMLPWVLALTEFFLVMSWDPTYTMPPKMIMTTLIIIGCYFGVKVYTGRAKQWLQKLLPKT